MKIKQHFEKKEIENHAKSIMKKYNCRKIASMIDERIPDYLDDDWEDEFEDEYEAYQEQGRGEAESDVVEQLVGEYQKKIKMEFDIDSFIEIGKFIAYKCGFEY